MTKRPTSKFRPLLCGYSSFIVEEVLHPILLLSDGITQALGDRFYAVRVLGSVVLFS